MLHLVGYLLYQSKYIVILIKVEVTKFLYLIYIYIYIMKKLILIKVFSRRVKRYCGFSAV